MEEYIAQGWQVRCLSDWYDVVCKARAVMCKVIRLSAGRLQGTFSNLHVGVQDSSSTKQLIHPSHVLTHGAQPHTCVRVMCMTSTSCILFSSSPLPSSMSLRGKSTLLEGIGCRLRAASRSSACQQSPNN